MGASQIQHVFVLMLENRSFDHMLGFSGVTGSDAATGTSTSIDGLTGTESNRFEGKTYTVSAGAAARMQVDPGHEFGDVLLQLCGEGATYPRGGAYPAINDSGYVASYVANGGSADPSVIMQCYSKDQVPILHALAAEFAICDNWHASIPGPTFPNRMFVHAASSNGLDHSPSNPEIVEWEAFGGFSFANGTIFDALRKKGIAWRVYAGDFFPMVLTLKGIHFLDIHNYSNFAADVGQASYPFSYTLIEPSYDVANDYRNGTSQHPLGDVNRGEALIKSTYEAIRNSTIWENSLLIITWDEHGGFYDHASPPDAVAPSSADVSSSHNKSGFTFEKYGPRVPAVVISPLMPKNVIDHRVYDHSSVLATIEKLFGVAPLTARDAAANPLTPLLTLTEARKDAPTTLPAAASGELAPLTTALADAAAPVPVSRPADTVNDGNLPGIVQSALRQDLELSPEAEHAAIMERVRSIETRSDAMEYLNEVRQKVTRVRAAGL